MFGGAKHGGFQHYTTCREVVVAKIPDSVPLSHAVVLPLGLSTSITGLFEHLKLDIPSGDAETKRKTVLIWGGSSSMGSTAIQLAVAAGYDVVSTASQRNHDYVKDLGALEVFDHTDPEVVEKISKRLQTGDVAGVYDCIGEEASTRACAAILSQFGGGVLPTVLWPPNDLPANVKATLGKWFFLQPISDYR
jgi:NADPH:quinone reductase-like Zn-dependent oxidoreductase